MRKSEWATWMGCLAIAAAAWNTTGWAQGVVHPVTITLRIYNYVHAKDAALR